MDIQDSCVVNNSATESGGGIYISAPSSGDFSFNVIGQIGNSTFVGNQAQIGGETECLKVKEQLHILNWTQLC